MSRRRFLTGLFCTILITVLLLSVINSNKFFWSEDASQVSVEEPHPRVGSNRNFEKYRLLAQKDPGVISALEYPDQDDKYLLKSQTMYENSDMILHHTSGNELKTVPKQLRRKNLDKFREAYFSDKEKTLKNNIVDTVKQLKPKIKETFTNNNDRKESERPYSNMAPFLDIFRQDNTVRHCVTGRKVVHFDPDVHLLPFNYNNSKYDNVMENSVGRLKSFENVFVSRAWGHGWDNNYKGLNASGRGATLDWAQETIATLHTVINSIKSLYNKSEIHLLDIPCGDMAWMARFLKTRDDVIYTGMDIVPELIKHHKDAFKHYSKRWSFINADAVDNKTFIGKYDIILCRTLLQHLYHQDVMKLLEKFSESGSKFILASTFANHHQNEELIIDIDNPGRFRKLNLQIPPFSLAAPLCLNRDGPPDLKEGLEHFLGLWKLPLKRVMDCDIQIVTPNEMPLKLYGCNIS